MSGKRTYARKPLEEIDHVNWYDEEANLDLLARTLDSRDLVIGLRFPPMSISSKG